LKLVGVPRSAVLPQFLTWFKPGGYRFASV
jgi:hypothetical protein